MECDAISKAVGEMGIPKRVLYFLIITHCVRTYNYANEENKIKVKKVFNKYKDAI